MTLRFSSTSIFSSFIVDKIDLINSTVVRNFFRELTSISAKSILTQLWNNGESALGQRRVPEIALTIGDAGIINYIQP